MNTEDIIEYELFKKQLQTDIQTGGIKPTSQGVTSSYKPTTESVFTDIRYDVPTSAIYDRLSDGSYTPMYENYTTAFGNEDRLAREQSTIEQIGKGLVKNSAKVFNYALDATVGTVYGLINSVKKGELSAFWDNDLSNWLDDQNKKLDYALPNYYTDEQKSMGFLRSLGTVNFWANDFTGALAFVGGAVLPEVVIGVLTGGSTLGVGAAKITSRLAAKGSFWGVGKYTAGALDKVSEFTRFSKGRDAIRGYHSVMFGKGVGDVTSTAAFLARSSGFEAGMEARHNFRESLQHYMDTYQENYGTTPSYDEIAEFTEKAKKAGNYVFGANLAVLSISNSVMFGKTLSVPFPKLGDAVSNVGSKVNNLGNRLIGLGTASKVVKEGGKQTLKHSMKGANLAQRFAGNTFLLLGKPATEGLWEEGMQGVAGGTMQRYLENLYNPTADAGYGVFASFTDALSEQYTSQEGWKEMGIGMMVGFAGGAVSNPKSVLKGEAFAGLGKNSRKSRYNQIQEQIEAANTGITTLQNLNRASAMKAMADVTASGETDVQSIAYENSFSNYMFIKSQEHLKSPSQIAKDFKTVVENTEMSNEELEAAGVDEATYKQRLVEEFDNNLKNYRRAERYAEALGLDRAIELPNGEKRQIKDAIVFNLMNGQNSLNNAQKVAKQIDAIIGSEGIYSYLDFYTNLKEESQVKAAELRTKKQQLNRLKKSARDLGQQLAGESVEGRRQFKTEVAERRYNEKAEKLTTITQQIAQVQSEVDAISSALDTEYKASITSFEQKTSEAMPTGDIVTAIAAIEDLDNYVQSLREYGKEAEAESLEYLIGQYKLFSDAHRQTMNMQRDMMQTGFFGSKKGKAFVNNLIGKKYEMSEEFKKLVRENNQYLETQFRNAGLDMRETTIEDRLKEAIEKNPELSEREKYKLESVIRLGMGMEAAVEAVNEIVGKQVVVSSRDVKAADPLEGDTVRLAQELTVKREDLTDLDAINKAIEEITSQINNVVNRGKANEKHIEQLEEQLETLKEKLYDKKDDQGVPSEEQDGQESVETQLDQEAGTEETSASRSIQEEIEEVERKIALAKKPFKIVDTEEYKRYNELLKKRDTEEGLTEQEAFELEQLETDIDQWLLVTGVVAEGLRLSDLIRQKVILEETEIENTEEIEEPTPETVIDQEDIVSSMTGNANMKYVQLYDKVLAKRVNDNGVIKYKLFHLNTDGLLELTGIAADQVSKDEKGNIVLSQEQVDFINSGSTPLHILINQEYSVVLQENSDGTLSPANTNFSQEFRDGGQNTGAVYRLTEGEEVRMVVNPMDDHNMKLIQEFKEEVSAVEPFMSETEFEAHLEEQVSIAKAKSTKLKRLKSEREKIQKKKGRKTAQDKKDIAAIEKDIVKEEQAVKKRTENSLMKKRDTGVDSKKLLAAKDKLKKGLVIHFYDNADANVGTAKGYAENAKKNADDRLFDSLRSAVIDNDAMLMEILNGDSATDVFVIDKGGNKTMPKLSVASTLLGHVNFTYRLNSDGVPVVEKRGLEDFEIDKVVDIGFVEDGVVKTKSGGKVRESFLGTNKKRSGKTPFVVVEVGANKVAIPVELKKRPVGQQEIESFEKVWESNLPLTSKVTKLNQMMAAAGIDIKERGNAFSTVNPETLTDKFFNDKLAQVKSINYFYDMNSWLSKENTLKDIVSDQVVINFDINNPLHSPKVVLNLSEVDVKPAEFEVNDDSKKGTKDKNDSSKNSALRGVIAPAVRENECD